MAKISTGWGYRLWIFLLCLPLAACGGGGGGGGGGGPADYFPFAQGNTWSFAGTIEEVDPELGTSSASFANQATISGTTPIQGLDVSIFRETNPFNGGVVEEMLLFKDAEGVVNFGNTDPLDTLTPQLVPYDLIRFPLTAGSSFQQLQLSGLNLGEDLDGDGTAETADVDSLVRLVGFEAVSVPAGNFADCARVETDTTITAILSSDGSRFPANQLLTLWLAPGVGWVQRVTVITADTPLGVFRQTVTERLSSFTLSN
ncbi:hypothetical protein DESUT3_05050 [Desulfuromonas versatilis]|uniref:Lipoprotein n=2 Tax=Desulfuromonas versatilis TaxID=2802975 RepID=A0ABM8HP74_9BACT|nr:hypothetical protein DESUT3_05050 [Desulfuromonas versatilis]